MLDEPELVVILSTSALQRAAVTLRREAWLSAAG
jgi:hypothetical protein